MRTVITHFYNESYMLPWWISHHLPMFDYGILIDYGSTDDSVEICRKLAPHWRVVPSRNLQFDAINADFEVMQYESELPGFKIALTVTEFLCGCNLPEIERTIIQNNVEGYFVGYQSFMVDLNPEDRPLPAKSLISQKRYGYIDKRFSRYYHRASIGAYTPGRHGTHRGNQVVIVNFGNIAKYTLSPWTPEFIERKLQIQTRISDFDKKAGFGFHHFSSKDKLNLEREEKLLMSSDLSIHLEGKVSP